MTLWKYGAATLPDDTMPIKNYRDLTVWQKAMDLAEISHRMTEKFPASERFGLIAQMRRAAISIPSNIAEGHGCGLTRRYIYHIAIAKGSLMELETQVLLAQRFGYADERLDAFLSLVEEVSRMLSTLRRRLTPRA
jgi:four helix bundle protein